MVKVVQAQQFIAALHAGRVCLHPTDTLPGLTFDPTSASAKHHISAIKGRDGDKPYLGLVATAAMARRFFAPLPGDWETLLEDLWPGPLSVIWQAAPQAPQSLVAKDGSIGLRVPSLPVDAAWMRVVLEAIELPLPTTSVNVSGDHPMRDFASAAAFLQERPGSFVPTWRPECRAKNMVHAEALPSTVIRLHAHGGYTMVREGAVAKARLEAMVNDFVSTAVLAY